MTKRELNELAKEIFIRAAAIKNKDENYKSVALRAFKAAEAFIAVVDADEEARIKAAAEAMVTGAGIEPTSSRL